MTTPLKLLIVEDRAADADLMLEYLRGAGFAVEARVVQTEPDFLAALASPPELILCDYRLPRFGGMRALELLKTRAPDIPFILVSGTIGEEQAVEAMRQGATDYLLKDRLGRLDSAVRRALEQKRARDEQQRMRAEVAHLAAIVENSNDAIISRTLDGVITSWNAGAERMFGHTAAEAIGQSADFIMLPANRGRIESNREQLLRGEIIPPHETSRITRCGRILDVLSSVSPIRNETGEVVAVANILHDVSSLRQAQNELKTSEERFRAVFEQAAVGMALRSIDPQQPHWLRVNQKLCDMLGYTREELLQLTSIDITFPADRGESVDYNRKLQNGELTSYSREKRYMRKNGSVMWASISLTAVHGPDGVFSHVISVIQDITARKQSETALAESERFAKSTIDALSEHLCVLDETGVIIAVNRAWRDFATANGAPADRDWIGVNYLAVCDAASDIHDAEGRVFAAGIRAVLGGERAEYALEYPCHAPHQQRWFLGRVMRFSDEGPVYLVITHENITGRKQSEHALIASEARLRAVLDNETECIKLFGSDGGLQEMNRAGLAMLEVENIEQARRRGVHNFVLPEHRERFERFLRAEPQQREAELVFEIEGLKGTRRWLESRATNLRLPYAEGECLLVVTRDITERRRAQEQIDYLMHHDRLTGLPDRGLFRNQIELALDRARSNREMIGVMIVNLDCFERFNEGLGVQAGDELLKAVAARLRAALRDVDTVSRLGGDEFAILVERATAVGELAAIAGTINQALSAPFEVRGQQVFLTASIGVGILPDGVNTPELLMQNADAAMRRVKQDGGNGFQLQEDDDSKRYRGYLDIEQRLRHALENGELNVHYQPKADLRSGMIIGVEALLRWTSPALGNLAPARFIPIAEETGLIIPIGAWVLRTACAQAAAWVGAGHPMDVAVNLSPRQFRDRHLLQTVVAALDSTGLAPQHLTLEITEGTAMSNAEHTVGVLNKLHDMGIKLAVDDFGTGYSSLAYLKRFPIDSLKIDRAFVIDVCSDANSRAIVSATVALAHSLNLKVVAEGVETEGQRDCLAAAGCDLGQGYLYGRAVPAAEFDALLKSHY